MQSEQNLFSGEQTMELKKGMVLYDPYEGAILLLIKPRKEWLFDWWFLTTSQSSDCEIDWHTGEYLKTLIPIKEVSRET